MTDPIEKIIQSIPLKSPSSKCDLGIQETLSSISNAPRLETENPGIQDSLSTLKSPLSVLTTALALLIGFLLGSYVNQSGVNSPNESEQKSLSSQVAGFELSDDVQVIEGESKTVIVSDSILVQDKVPVRKLETVTRKRVRVKNSNKDTDEELDVPIRKVFFTLAETI